ncbi:AMP-binding protein [Arthrobacter cryoconiti]|uniref:AMP-binding protein n=1 Tax=Arthrobacter cryoconiti TaxID=748907 RepID=A0ABV8QWU8_9MICC|nr:AMP-binding protein [Arthrobacter cryoconiti]MCC9068984.1 AMP-binding protein [Arthrobacter cryoconiti]
MNTQERVQELRRTFAAPGADTVQLLCERHLESDVAFTVVDADLGFNDVTYGELSVKSLQFAAALASLGIQRGDRVATLMGTSVELVVALLGIWRLGAVDVPLFTAFAPDAISSRLRASTAKLVICDAEQRSKLVPPGHVPNDASTPVIVAHGEAFGYDSSFAEMVQGRGAFSFLNADDGSLAAGGSVAIGGDGVLVERFTSEPTSSTRSVPLLLQSVASFASYQELALDVRDEDVFFNVADPDDAYGLYFALLGPMACGTRSIIVAAELSPAILWSVLHKFKVTNFAAESTVYLALRAASEPGSSARLRRASSVGVPLTPDVMEWGQESFGVEIKEHCGHAELGMSLEGQE